MGRQTLHGHHDANPHKRVLIRGKKTVGHNPSIHPPFLYDTQNVFTATLLAAQLVNKQLCLMRM